MRRSLFILVILALLFDSCRKQITDFECPAFDPVPVLNAVLVEGGLVKMHLSFAQSLDSIHPAYCDKAEVMLYEDGKLTECLQYDGDGFYRGETRVKSNHEYACKVVIPDHDTLFARTFAPARPIVKDLEVLENATVNEEGQSFPAILVTFKNDLSKELYFTVNLDAFFRTDYESGSYSTMNGTIYSSINTDDPVLLNEGSEILLFSNEIISDSIYKLKINASFSSYSSFDTGDSNGSIVSKSGYVVLRMLGLSESCYQYMKSQAAFVEPDAYTNLFLGTVAPLNTYSNVKNGMGVFAAIAPVTLDTLYFHSKNE